jgi:drug/metabolite transporter (DMT)-like permease
VKKGVYKIFNILLISSLYFPLATIQGEIAALSAALLWSIASILYGSLGQSIPPLQLNFLKGIIAVILLVITLIIRGELISGISPLPLFLFLLSGIIGIGLGDVAFLAAINALGARRVLLIGTLTPPITAILATIFLQERLNLSAWCGILITIIGVAWVVTERTPDTNDNQNKVTNKATSLLQGVGLGLLYAIFGGVGAVLSRAAFASANISPLWAALLRLSSAVIFLLGWAWLRTLKGVAFSFESLSSSRPLGKTIMTAIFASFCGTFLGIWLQQTAIKLTAVGIASTLLQTSPLFVIPLAIWMGEKVTLRAIAGVLVAILGIGLLFYFRG